MLREPDQVSEDLVQSGVEALHPAVDVTLLLLNRVQDLGVVVQGEVQSRSTGP